MTEIEYQDVNNRLVRLEQNLPNDFLLGLYTDLVRQHINLLKDLVHNRFSREDFENQIRLEKDVKILERNLANLSEILTRNTVVRLKSGISEIVSTTESNVN
jgi:hypothetical protein